MKIDIILCGVGGQGILSIATIIGEAATKAGLNLKQAEVHGMSQRGGDVQSHLRLSDEAIYSDLIAQGAADMIISMEPMESLRYLQYLAADGKVVTGSEPFVNIPYPLEFWNTSSGRRPTIHRLRATCAAHSSRSLRV